MNKKENSLSFGFWIVFAIAVGLKYGYEKFHYYPVLDDWLQYGVYQMYEHPLQIFLNYSYHTRPLASLFDIIVWGKFWPDLTLPFIVITALHIGACFLLYRIFHQLHLSLGIPAALIFGLMPLGNEATYWISASSRLVVGLFFMLLSLYFLTVSLNKRNKKLYMIGFWFFQLVSFGFYEQVIAMGFASSLIMIIWKRKLLPRWWYAALPVLNVVIIGSYYVLFKDHGNAEERGHMVAGNEFWGHVGYVFHQFYDISVFTHAQYYTRGLQQAFTLLFAEKSYSYFLAIMFISILCGWFAFKTASHAISIKAALGKVIVGLLLSIFPLGPFFLIGDTGLALRNVFPSMIGFAIAIDGLFDLLGKRVVIRYVYGLLAGLLAFLFMTIGVNDISDYKKVSEVDRMVAANIVMVGNQEHKFTGQYPVYVFGAESHLVPVSVPFLNHIKNVTDSDWALTGTVRTVGQNKNYPDVTPVSAREDQIIPEKDLQHGLLLGLDKKLTVVPLRAVKKSNGDYSLIRRDGSLFGVYYVKAQHFKWK